MFSANKKQNQNHELFRTQRRLHEFTLSSHWSTWRSTLYLCYSFTTLVKKRSNGKGHLSNKQNERNRVDTQNVLKNRRQHSVR